jgi:hypothetical protein
MTPCDRLRADAAGLAALPAGDAERAAAFEHAGSCSGCRRALEEAERLQAVVGDLRPSPPGTDSLARASRAIVSELRREARWRMLASALAVCAAFVLFVALARDRSPARQDRVLAFALAAAAAVLGAASRRWTVAVVPVAVLAALGAAAATGVAGILDARVGLDCLATELACAAAVVAGAWLAIRRGTSSLAPGAVTAGAAAGAVAGAAALQLTCPAHASLPHLLAFHVGGVLLASAAAGAVWRLVGRTSQASPP